VGDYCGRIAAICTEIDYRRSGGHSERRGRDEGGDGDAGKTDEDLETIGLHSDAPDTAAIQEGLSQCPTSMRADRSAQAFDKGKAIKGA
jgi:hypothetical protein